MEGEWGYVTMSDGTQVPLEPPKDLTPEEKRKYLAKTPQCTIWTEKEK